MNSLKNDPRLTAYALGELNPKEQLELENLLAKDQEAYQEVQEIKASLNIISNELKKYPVDEFSPQRRENILKQTIDSEKEPIYKRPPLFSSDFIQALAICLVLVIGGGYLFRDHAVKRLSSITEQVFSSAENKLTLDDGPAYVPHAAAPFKMKMARNIRGENEAGPEGLQRYNNNFNTESYDRIEENDFLNALAQPLSTFSIDVDTAAYSNMRRFIKSGHLPPKDSIRLEELINYFDYDYPTPKDEHPFSINMEMANCPWNIQHKLVRIGLKGLEIKSAKRPSSNLVFLVDVSGSMEDPNKLPLLVESMKLLVDKLDSRDKISMVVYAGAGGMALSPTSGDKKSEIKEALDNLKAGGSTNGGAGIELAYKMAQENFIKDGANRVILATDGDFNVGTTNQGDLTRLIEEKAKSGVYLTILGFGMGNYQDSTLEKLSNKGHGNYAYIDTLNEAKKVLVNQLTGTLVTIAKDVKIQVEFNPTKVNAYRLLGYENRLLQSKDFNDDKKQAGDIGAGHTVTALYEVVPVGVKVDVPSIDPLKYQKPQEAAKVDVQNKELLTIKFRYKKPDGDTSILMTESLSDQNQSFKEASADFRFASAVAAFGLILRDSKYKGEANISFVLKTAQESSENDPHHYRKEFIQLVESAQKLK